MEKKRMVADTEKKKTSKKTTKQQPYFFAVGRRKTARALVKLHRDGQGDILVNQRKLNDYFPTLWYEKIVTDPLHVTGLMRKVTILAKALGGGISAQAQALSLGIARALVKSDGSLKTVLKKHKLLTRDSREKERKKPGLKRARRAPQWQKR